VLSRQILRFIVVGLINTIAGYSFYALFIYLGLSYVYALGLATVIGVLFNFQTIGRLVFNSKDNALLLKFILVYVIVFGINLVLVDCGMRLGLGAYLAGAVAILPSAAISFILNKYLVFKR
jgi:putative flippase GtrA